MSNAEWITDRPPTEADGDEHQEVRLKRWPHWVNFVKVHWSHVGFGVPWQHTSDWQPPAEPAPAETDRIAALEQRVAELEAMVRPSAEPPAERLRLPIDHCIRLDRACLGD
jgi:hypothetical protein